MPKGPVPANDPSRGAERSAGRAEFAESRTAQGQAKASTPFKNKSAARGPGNLARTGSATTANSATTASSATRDAEWMAQRSAEPERDSVRLRFTEPKGGTASEVAMEFIARVEEPIAARLMEHDVQRTESPPGEAPGSAPPVAAANVAQQVSAGNGIEKKREKKATKKGRGIMKLKWFAGDEEAMLGTNGSNNAPNEPAQRAPEAAPRSERGLERATERPAAAKPPAMPAGPSGESAGGFEAELLPVEDIYRVAGITSPRRGYSIGKVVEMLRSEHLRGASRELRRAAVLMALDAAGVTVDEVLQDAKVRQEAVDAYAAEQRKHAEAQWARKAEENLQIQAELELVKAHYGERIRRNLDGVAREKATFGSWLKAKEQETQGMAEAVEQVLKAPAPSEAAVDSLLSVTVSSVTGKPV